MTDTIAALGLCLVTAVCLILAGCLLKLWEIRRARGQVRLARTRNGVSGGAGCSRDAARIVAALWAGCGIVIVVAVASLSVLLLQNLCGADHDDCSLSEVIASLPLELWFIVASLILVPWLSAAIPWAWQGAGGVLLVMEGLLPLLPGVWMAARIALRSLERDAVETGSMQTAGFTLLGGCILGAPPVLAGSLFLASWWGSRSARARAVVE